jgi:hypothetical protein
MSNTRTAAAKKTVAKKASGRMGLREALALKIRRVEHFDVPIVESAVVAAATLKLTEAQEALAYARITDPKSVDAGEARVAAAKKDVAACFRRTFFKGLPTLEMEALQNEHPDPKLKEGEKPPPEHVPFVFWLAAATCTEGDLSAQEWKGYADEWTVGTLNRFTDAVYGSTTKDFSHGIPKD